MADPMEVFFSTYLTGYIQYVQYPSTSASSNQSSLSSVTLSGCNLQSPPMHSSFSPLKIKNFYGLVTAHIFQMGGKCGQRKKKFRSEVAERSTISVDNMN